MIIRSGLLPREFTLNFILNFIISLNQKYNFFDRVVLRNRTFDYEKCIVLKVQL